MSSPMTALAAELDMVEWEGLLAEFETYQHSAGILPKTMENRGDLYRALAKRSGKSPTQITRGDLLDMMTRPHFRTGQPLSAGTKQSERSYLQSFFAWMYEEGYRTDDPARKLPRVRVPRRKPRPVRIAQINDILDSGAYTRTRDLVTIAALSGLRIGEIVKIRGEDVDLEAGMIFSLRKGGYEHYIPLHPVLIELAARYPRQGWWFPSPFASKSFPNGGGHILMASASLAISNAIHRAGITDTRITAHSLRHFYASQMLAQGASIRVIQEMMGHASLATTQLYTEVTEEMMTSAVHLLADIEVRAHSSRRPRAPKPDDPTAT